MRDSNDSDATFGEGDDNQGDSNHAFPYANEKVPAKWGLYIYLGYKFHSMDQSLPA